MTLKVCADGQELARHFPMTVFAHCLFRPPRNLDCPYLERFPFHGKHVVAKNFAKSFAFIGDSSLVEGG